MINAYLKIYNYLSALYGDGSIADDDTGMVDSRWKPKYWYSVYNIDTNEVIAHTFKARYNFECFKLVGDVITEHYRYFGDDKPIVYQSLELSTGKPIEYYTFDGSDLSKFDSNSSQYLSKTSSGNIEDFPLDYKSFIKSLSDVSPVYWADKSYGRVVGVIERKFYTKI